MHAIELKNLGRAPDSKLVVCIIDENPIALAHLLAILQRNRRIRSFTLNALDHESAPHSRPLVFVLDRHGTPLPVIECLRRLKRLYAQAKYIVIDQKQSKSEVYHWLSIGIHGLIAPAELNKDLVNAIRLVSNGTLRIPFDMLQEYVERGTSTRRTDTLQRVTQREAHILELAKYRLTNREIANLLGIRVSTVKFHLSNIFSKLQIPNRHGLDASGADNKLSVLDNGWAKVVMRPSAANQ